MPIYRFYIDVNAPSESKAKDAIATFNEHVIIEDCNALEDALTVEQLHVTQPPPNTINWRASDNDKPRM
jgi:hypothetical protein